jgi:hypothetical protein
MDLQSAPDPCLHDFNIKNKDKYKTGAPISRTFLMQSNAACEASSMHAECADVEMWPKNDGMYEKNTSTTSRRKLGNYVTAYLISHASQ